MICWKRPRQEASGQTQGADYEMEIMKLKEICWDKAVKEAVWKKGKINPDYSPHVLRWDAYGRIMMWSKYGHTDSRFGWTIEAREAQGNQGADDLDNLFPVSTYTPEKKYKTDMESPSTGG